MMGAGRQRQIQVGTCWIVDFVGHVSGAVSLRARYLGL